MQTLRSEGRPGVGIQEGEEREELEPTAEEEEEDPSREVVEEELATWRRHDNSVDVYRRCLSRASPSARVRTRRVLLAGASEAKKTVAIESNCLPGTSGAGFAMARGGTVVAWM